jgi:ferric-dicitrate binding protein FerR (iron transport regulator)
MNEDNSYQELLLRYLDGTLCSDEEAQVAELLRSDAQARTFLRDVAEQAVTVADVERTEASQQEALAARQNWAGLGRRRLRGWSWVMGIAACLALMANILYFLAKTESKTITITGITGHVQWTGNGGHVRYDLNMGTTLPGGTIEGTTPNSWFEFEYHDGSTVTLSGISSLVFSDRGQKILHLKEGTIVANVMSQSTSKPMLIHTPTAILEVVGTQFETTAEHTTTTLKVNEGKVRVERLSDGSRVDVPAQYQVVVIADQEMQLVPVPKATPHWKSQLSTGPTGLYGKWFPKTSTEEAILRAIACTTHKGVLFYMASLEVSRGSRPPVLLQPGSHLHVKGQIESPEDVYFGISVRYPNGGFAGRFGIKRPAKDFHGSKDFDMLLDLTDFQLDVTLAEIKDILPDTPFYLIVDSIWCLTLDHQAELDVFEMEILPPATPENSIPIEGLHPPMTDIWTAASQGDLETVKQQLAAGVDIDVIFVIPGVPGSGATPLHIAVLSDQRTVAQFLIDQGAKVNARAQDKYGGTPLHWAAALGRFEVAKTLIHAGADVMSTDNNGKTPLDCTTIEQFPPNKARLDIAQLLRKSISEQKK